MQETTRPNFFVVGAPKSGTTSLYYYLKSHPQIFIPGRKELLFFCDDLHFTYPILNEKQFLDYYHHVKNQRAIGEISVWNLYSEKAAENIFQFNPASKIIIMLRHPADMMYALHSNHVFNDNENIPNFEEALKAEPERRRGEKISPVIKCPIEGLYYTGVASYSSQVQRYLDVFGAENVKVILFDDFISETEKIYRELLRFLQVDESILPEFKIYNQRKTTRSETLKRITIDAPEWLKSIGRKIFPHQTPQRDRLMQWMWKINTKEIPQKEMAPELRKKIIAGFTPEIHRLEEVIRRDLSHWLF